MRRIILGFLKNPKIPRISGTVQTEGQRRKSKLRMGRDIMGLTNRSWETSVLEDYKQSEKVKTTNKINLFNTSTWLIVTHKKRVINLIMWAQTIVGTAWLLLYEHGPFCSVHLNCISVKQYKNVSMLYCKYNTTSNFQ